MVSYGEYMQIKILHKQGKSLRAIAWAGTLVPALLLFPSTQVSQDAQVYGTSEKFTPVWFAVVRSTDAFDCDA
jgi:hypothetical protein